VYTLEYATQLHYFNVASNQYHRVLRLIKLHLSRVPRSIGVPLKAALGECSTCLAVCVAQASHHRCSHTLLPVS
jgi:hypothetical protein